MPAVLLEAVVAVVLQQGLGGGRQVRRASGEGMDSVHERVHHPTRCVPSGYRLVIGAEELVEAALPSFRKVSPQRLLELGSLRRVGFPVRSHPGLPIVLQLSATGPGLAEPVQDLIWHGEGISIGPAQGLLCQTHLFFAKRLAMSRGGPRLVGAPVADDGAADHQAGATRLRPCHFRGRFHGPHVHPINRADHVPAVGLEPLGHVLREGDVGVSLDGDVVVVVKVDELAQAQGARQRRGLRGHTFLQVAV